MNRKLYRLVAGFLLVFVAVSLAPKAPEIARSVAGWSFWPAAWAAVAGLQLPTNILESILASPLLDLSGVLPVILVGGLTVLLLFSMTRRHLASRSAVPARGKRPATSTAVARSRSQAVARAAKDDSLGAQIRQAAIQGERAAALAKRFGVSQDAVRVATGRSVVPSPRTSAGANRNRPATLSTLSVARAAAGGPSTALPRG
jgi:hypothetical protein